MNERLYNMKEVKKILGIGTTRIQQLDRAGKIKCVRTIGGRRRIPQSEIDRILGKTKTEIIIYARVNSYDQKKNGDLDRQVELLKSNIKETNKKIHIITDIGSGLNEKRKGLNKLLDLVFTNNVAKIYITYEDRFTRFGFGYLKKICNQFGTEIVVVNNNEDEKRDLMRELVKDIISLVTSLSGKLYGMRSHKNKKIIKVIKDAIK